MSKIENLKVAVDALLGNKILSNQIALDELTLVVAADDLY